MAEQTPPSKGDARAKFLGARRSAGRETAGWANANRERLTSKPLGRTLGGEGRVAHDIWYGALETGANKGAGFLVFVPSSLAPDGHRPREADLWNAGTKRRLHTEIIGGLLTLLDSEDPAEIHAGQMFLRAICRIAAARNESAADFLLDAPGLDARVIDTDTRAGILTAARRGLSLRTIAATNLISLATLDRWRAEDPAFAAELDAAAGERLAQVEESVISTAAGFRNGQELVPGDANVGLRVLAARNPEDWAPPDATALAREQVSRLANAINAVVDAETFDRIIAVFRGGEAPALQSAAQQGTLEPHRE